MLRYLSGMMIAAAAAGTAQGQDARWITAPGVDCPLLRTEFTLIEKPARAVIRIAGLGHFQLRVNGQDPGGRTAIHQPWSKYDRTIYFEEIDLVPFVQRGGNAIGVMLGNSFWHCAPVPKGRYHKVGVETDYGTPFLLWVEAEFEAPGGTRTRIVSDETWKTWPGPVTFSHVYAGEDYDARLEQAGWDSPGFNHANWKPAVQVMCIDAVIGAAGVLDKAEDAARYRRLREQTAAAFVKAFYNPATKTFAHKDSPQCAHSIALAAGLVPEPDKAAVLDAVLVDLAKRGWQQTPGDIGHVFFIRALAEGGAIGRLAPRVFARRAGQLRRDPQKGTHRHAGDLGRDDRRLPVAQPLHARTRDRVVLRVRGRYPAASRRRGVEACAHRAGPGAAQSRRGDVRKPRGTNHQPVDRRKRQVYTAGGGTRRRACDAESAGRHVPRRWQRQTRTGGKVRARSAVRTLCVSVSNSCAACGPSKPWKRRRVPFRR